MEFFDTKLKCFGLKLNIFGCTYEPPQFCCCCFFVFRCKNTFLTFLWFFVSLLHKCTKIFYQSNYSVHRGINAPSKTPASLSCQAPLKSANCPSLPFLGNPPSIPVFCKLLHPVSRIFQWTPKTSKFFILNPILFFKSN